MISKKYPIPSPNGTADAQLLTVGFCTDKEQESQLKAAGVDLVWMLGRGMEELRWALSYLRGRTARLIIACNLTIFGENKKQLLGTLRICEMKGVKEIIDIAHPEDETFAQRLKRAFDYISKARFLNDPRKAKRCGAKGGAAKGAAAWLVRNEIAPRWLIENMVKALGVVTTALLLENKISASTLRRQYFIKLET